MVVFYNAVEQPSSAVRSASVGSVRPCRSRHPRLRHRSIEQPEASVPTVPFVSSISTRSPALLPVTGSWTVAPGRSLWSWMGNVRAWTSDFFRPRGRATIDRQVGDGLRVLQQLVRRLAQAIEVGPPGGRASRRWYSSSSPASQRRCRARPPDERLRAVAPRASRASGPRGTAAAPRAAPGHGSRPGGPGAATRAGPAWRGSPRGCRPRSRRAAAVSLVQPALVGRMAWVPDCTGPVRKAEEGLDVLERIAGHPRAQRPAQDRVQIHEDLPAEQVVHLGLARECSAISRLSVLGSVAAEVVDVKIGILPRGGRG